MKINTAHSPGTLLSLIFVTALVAREPSAENTNNVHGSPNDQAKAQSVAQSIADDYVRALNLTAWSMNLAQWVTSRGFKGAVDTFQSGDWSRWEFEKYCFKTRIEKDESTTEYTFFDNGDYSNPKAILQQVLIFDRRTQHDNELGRKVWETISDSLTRMFGPPSNVPEDDMLEPFGLGALTGEREPQLWQDSVKRIVLAEHFRWNGGVRTDFILLLSRERALDSLVFRFQRTEQNYGNSIFQRGSLISEMCDSLRLTKTPLSLLCGTDSLSKSRLHDLVQCGDFISEAERIGDSVHLPLYLMAFHMFGQTYSPQGSGDGPGPWVDVDTLKHYNIVFEWSHLGEGWTYSESPLTAIYTKYPSSRWGQLAFVLLQNTGWCFDGMCNGNNGPEVVSKGEEFLKGHPESIYATAILLTIAKAYETNWNVSTCEIESPYMYDPNYRSDKDSRLKAISTYERILIAYPASGEAEIAKLRLPRLKLGINTGRTDYFFIYD